MSRVIVKNLPKHASEERLREHFATVGEVTDCRLKKTADGKSRQFAFVGFRKEADAKAAIKGFHQTFFDTGKISVEAAHAPGSESLARPWSRYAAGSTAHAKRGQPAKQPPPEASGAERQAAGRAKARATAPKPLLVAPAAGQRSVRVAAVQPRSAGTASRRVHVEFASSDDEAPTAGAASSGSRPGPGSAGEGPGDSQRASGAAFDEDLSDLAYLRKKVSSTSPDAVAAAPDSAAAADEADRGPSKKVLKKAKRKAKKGAVAQSADQDGAQDANAAEENGNDPAVTPQAADSAADRAGVDDRDDLESTGRLFVTNIPYGATEEELHAHFETLGEVASVHLCKDEDSLKSRGLGYVAYVFPECAVRALSELSLKPFQGRLLHMTPARSRPPAEAPAGAAAAGGSRKSAYKQRLAEKKKAEAGMQHTWNLLYVSASAAADAASAELGLSKGELFGKEAQGAAVTAALTETSIIQQTKRWLQKEGIRVDAFERSGPSLVASRLATEGKDERREDAFVVKHLPAGSSLQELRERFARYGELIRCTLAPSGTVAVVQYAEKGHAKRAFQKLAFSRYRHVPLYLEWAPGDVFTGPASAREAGAAADDEADAAADAAGRDDGAEEPAQGCLFVKNLSFATTDAALKSAFASCRGFRSAVVMKKKAALKQGGSDSGKEGLSMGYGFLEFDTAASAMEVLKRRQGATIDGHAVQLQVSQARGAGRQGGRSDAVAKAKGPRGITTTRICVRNLAFEATQKELRSLFGAYGSVTAVRIPKKADYSGHRGFAFVDFASKSEAASAFEALQHTHLYGRRMVLEPAEEKASDVGSAQQEAMKRQASKALRSEAKRRRRAGVLDTTGADAAFAEALDA